MYYWQLYFFQGEMTCEACEKRFPGLKPYRVHMRTHSVAKPYFCNAKGCQKSYLSRPLLWKHQIRRHPELSVNASRLLEDKRGRRAAIKYGASSVESVLIAQSFVEDLLVAVVKRNEPEEDEEGEMQSETEEKTDSKEEDANSSIDDNEQQKETEQGTQMEDEEEDKQDEYDPVDAAVRSIMGPEGSFDIRKSPVKSPFRPPLSSIHGPLQTRVVRASPPVPLPPQGYIPPKSTVQGSPRSRIEEQPQLVSYKAT